MSDLKKYTDYKTILAVNALIWCGGKVLLLKRAASKKVDPNKYSGIGGKVEPGEDFLTAIKRELQEETGIVKFKNIRPYSITQIPDPPTNAEWVNIYFYIEIDKQVEIGETEDGTFHWIDPNFIDDLVMVSDLKEYIPILTKNSQAFILGQYNFDNAGKLMERKTNIF